MKMKRIRLSGNKTVHRIPFTHWDDAYKKYDHLFACPKVEGWQDVFQR